MDITMKWWRLVSCVGGLLAVLWAGEAVSAATGKPDLTGTWRLNRGVSEFPHDLGFGPDWQDPDSKGNQASGRGGGGSRRSGRGGGGGSVNIRPPVNLPESEEDSLKIDQLLGEVRDPSPSLTIVQSESAVTITDDRGTARTFHTNGKEEFQKLDAGPMGTTSKWAAGTLVIEYRVAKDQELRYSYGRDGPRLQVRVQLLEKGKGAPITRIYDAAPSAD
jgi:hypothetical protein